MAGTDDHGGRRALIFAGIVGLLILVAGWAATVSPLFRLQDLSVVGLDHLTQSQVLRLAQVSGSTNVLWLAPGKVEERIEADPWVAHASVSKDLPSGLSISVEERIPAATAGGDHAWLVVAGDGTVIDVTKARPALPEMPGVAGLEAGQKVPGDHLAAAQLAGELAHFGISEDVGRVIVDPTGELRVVLVGGGKVTVGTPEDLGAKAEAIAGIVKWAKDTGSKIRSIDVTAPGAPAAKVSRGTPPVEG